MSRRTRGGGGGGEGVQADAGKQLAQPAELPVLGPEVVAPLADAVRLVDGDEPHRRAARGDAAEEDVGALADQPLGRHVEQAEAAVADAGHDVRFWSLDSALL